MLVIENGLLTDSPARHIADSYVALSMAAERLTGGGPPARGADRPAAVFGLIRVRAGELKEAARAAGDPAGIVRTDPVASRAIAEVLAGMRKIVRRRAAPGEPSDAAGQLALALLKS